MRDESHGPQTRSLVVPSADGTPLFVRVHRPLQRPADRTLLIVHGMGQHGGRFPRLVERAVGRGWCVVAGDLRGHGRSGGVATHLDRFEQYLADLDAVFETVPLDPERTAMFAHSMGGLATARFLQTRGVTVGGVVLSSPLLALRVKVPRLKETMGRVCALIAPRMRFQTKVRDSQVTSNAEAIEVRRSDPLSIHSVTAGWYFQVLDAVCEAWEDASRLTAPLVVLQGGRDSLVDPDAACRWMPRVGSTDKTLRILPDRLHELMHEPGWEEMFEGMFDWLDRRVPARGPAQRSPKALQSQIRRVA
jgi:lysophospholipase